MTQIVIASIVAVLSLTGFVLCAIAIEDRLKSRKKNGVNRKQVPQ